MPGKHWKTIDTFHALDARGQKRTVYVQELSLNRSIAELSPEFQQSTHQRMLLADGTEVLEGSGGRLEIVQSGAHLVRLA
jgi:hypothetical protein